MMNKKDQKEILEIWHALGLSLMYITGDKEEFFKTVKEELGYQWDGEGVAQSHAGALGTALCACCHG